MIHKVLLIALLCCCNVFGLKATGQIPDLIIIGKDTLALLGCPIEVDSILRKQVGERLTNQTATSCWRAYQALWRIEDSKLILEKIVDSCSIFAPSDSLPEVTVDRNGIFDCYRDKRGRVVATWYTGQLKVVSGDMIYYNHMGFSRDYEQETVYNIKQGMVTSQTAYRNSLKKGIPVSQGVLFAASQFNGDRFPELNDSRMNVFVRILPKPDGSIDRIDMRFVSPQGISPERQQLYRQEIRSCLEQVPQWDVLVLHDTIQMTEKVSVIFWQGKGWQSKWNRWSKQIPDVLSYNDTIYSLEGFPLQYDMNIYAKVKPYLKERFSLDCFRGYIGHWKIENGKLYLVKLLDKKDNSPLLLGAIFNLPDDKPIEATWYSGELALVHSNVLRDGCTPKKNHEKDVLCDVVSGSVTKIEKTDRK